MAHTPGPWRLLEDDGCFFIKMAKAITSPGQFEPQHLISWDHGLYYDPDAGDYDSENRQYLEARDTARLIAAAPAIFEALKAVERIFDQGTANTTIDEWDEAYGKVQTALVEAYGEEGQP